MEWIQLMVSNHSFLGNMKLETHARLKEGGQGIGFLLNIKPEEERKDLFHESFFFWVGSKQKPGCSLFHSNISLLENPNIFLTPSFSHCIRIEKTENHLKLYLDNVLALDYLSHIPFHGPLFGIILKDAEIEIGTILLSSSSPNILINCLSVADTLLSLRYFKPALSEYKQIAKSFAGRAEGREATFRAGITLLEEAKKKSGKEKEQLQQQALEEFGYLHNTPGAPLEYLGKSLIYKATQDILEEIKCLELSLRKFPKHPLTQWIKDQLVFRLHEAFYKDRKSTYHFTLLCIKQIPEIFEKKDHQNLLKQLQRSFVSPDFLSPPCRFQSLALQLAFWLDKPSDLLEIIDSSLSLEKEAIASLLYLGYMDLVRQLSPKIFPLSFLSGTQALDLFFLDQFYLVGDKERQSRLKLLLAHPTLDPLVLQRNIEFLIFFQRKQEARALLSQMAPISSLSDASPFYFLWGCLLALEEGEKAALSFLSHQMNGFFLGKPGRSSKWFQEAFFFEKALFFKQQMLFYRACHQEKKFLVAEKRLYQLYREKSMK